VTTSTSDFLDLAEREAARYGGESLVFLRELLQNARDAGACRVVIETKAEHGFEAISVTDDGRGMVMEHAGRFLLTLYASSKKRDSGAAGRFGVGFWSILRFEPTEITIASRSVEAEDGWEIVFDGELEIRKNRRLQMQVGTTVRMKRTARKGDLGSSAWDLVRRDARHLRQPVPSEELVEVLVNGRPATEPMTTKEPGLMFRRSGLRGVISLGAVPEVILLAHGLRVRSAASVDDLLLRPDRRSKKPLRVPSSGLSPRVVIDCDRLAVLMDRGDVAQDRALVAVTRVIRSETRRLCEMELERLAPRTMGRRIWDVVVKQRAILGIAALTIIGLVMGILGASWVNERSVPPRASATPSLVPEPYIDRSDAYGGPVTEEVDGVGGVPSITYSPVDQRPFLAAFRISGIDEDGHPIRSELALRPDDGRAGDSGLSLEIEVIFRTSGPLLRLPVPTGAIVDEASVILNGYAADLLLTHENEPVLRLGSEASGRVRYRTIESASEGYIEGRWPLLPTGVAEMATGLKEFPPLQRVERAVLLVRSSLRGAGPFEAAGTGYSGFFGSVFDAGGGDCDVVNTVLAAVLSEAGLQARLAVGWIGRGGVANPGLHAWVEVDLGGGRWVPADATTAVQDGAAVPHVEQPAEVSLEERPEQTRVWSVGASALLGGGLLFLGIVISWWKLRARREFKASKDLDPGPLVESLLRDREAWPGFSGAWRRPLVPTCWMERQSLERLESAASRTALFVAKSPGEWVAQVIEGGGLILDGSTRAGRAAAVTFAAFDLDQWEILWRRSRNDAFGLRVQEALRRAGMKLELRFVGDLEDCGGSGLALDEGARAWVVVNEASPGWQRCRDLSRVRPRQAIFRAADIVVELLPSSGRRAQQALSELARTVLKEMSVDLKGTT